MFLFSLDLLINEHSLQQYNIDSVYGLNNQMESTRYNAYGFESTVRGGQAANGTSGSTALYHHNGSRYGLGLGRGAPDGKMNGLHGTKHKRGDMDRKSPYPTLLRQLSAFGSQSFCWHSFRGFARRDPYTLQGPAWVPLPPEKTRRGYPRTQRHDFPGNLWTLCRSHDRYHSGSSLIGGYSCFCKTRLEIIFVRSCWSTLRTSSGILFANPWLRTWSTSPLTCTEPVLYKK